jgi:hypothetical protein
MGSTRAAREAQRYGEGLATSEYNTYVDRLAGLAGFGETGTQQAGGILQNQAGSTFNVGSNLANTALQAGDIRMSGYQTQGDIAAQRYAYQGSLYGDIFNRGR